MPPQTDPQDPNANTNQAPAPAPTPAAAPAPAPTPAPASPAPASTSGAGHVDFEKLVLPRKNEPSLDSAQRVNAGVLFEAEQSARLPMPPKEAPAAPTPAPKAEQPIVKPLQTFKGDIESLVGEQNISVVSIAAAEADKRGKEPLAPETPAPRSRAWLRAAIMVSIGLTLLAGAGGIGYYLYVQSLPLVVGKDAPSPFISVDETQIVVIRPSDHRTAFMQALVAARNSISLSLGLIARLQVATPTGAEGALEEMSAGAFIGKLSPSAPQELLRTLEAQMLLGVHSYDENAAFMILKTDSYEVAYAGMLAWEKTMEQELVPLFSRTPPVRARPESPTPPADVPQVQEDITPLPTSTATSTGATATSTATTTAGTSLPPLPRVAQFSQGNFVDKIVENRDARVVLNAEGDILLLWTMLDRSTIVITTNEATLREVISRLSQTSILSLPTR